MILYFLHQKQYREKMRTTTNSIPDIISNEKEALKTYRLHVGGKKKGPVHSWRILIKILDLKKILQLHVKNIKNILYMRIKNTRISCKNTLRYHLFSICLSVIYFPNILDTIPIRLNLRQRLLLI